LESGFPLQPVELRFYVLSVPGVTVNCVVALKAAGKADSPARGTGSKPFKAGACRDLHSQAL